MSEVAKLERQKEDTKKAIEVRDSILRLVENKDYKFVVDQLFCTEECARYVHTSGNPNLDPASQKDALNIAQAAGHFRRFISAHIQMGNAAENSMSDLEDALVEARAEEA